MSVTTDLGKILLFPVGDWSSSSTYEFLDIVYNEGTSYVAKQQVPTGTSITNNTYWQILASGNIGSIINDNKGDGDTNYCWSADKCWNEINNLRQRIEQLES